MQWPGNFAKVLNEMMVVVTETQKSLQFFQVFRFLPLSNGCDLARVHAYFTIANDIAKVLDVRLFKYALTFVEVELVLLQYLQDCMVQKLMGVLCLDEDEDVIEVDNDTSCTYQLVKNVVYESLECSRRVGKPKEHHHWFKKFQLCLEDSFPLIAFFNVYIVEAPSNVILGIPYYYTQTNTLTTTNHTRDSRRTRHMIL